MELNNIPDNLVFYDGECGFCNSSVQFILAKKKRIFYFTALQSITAKTILENQNTVINMDTIYYLKGGKLYDRSSAALQLVKGLKGAYPLLFVFYIVPKFMRDPLYNFIAARRHKIRTNFCLIPSEKDAQYFIKN
ncbi:MAG: putative DCC family thiol-disulfide oxidoreductase YuxK [Crocinitomix sp.]|jgi:predicted DCC family thiol-disulfide oxidoreductase YuxK